MPPLPQVKEGEAWLLGDMWHADGSARKATCLAFLGHRLDPDVLAWKKELKVGSRMESSKDCVDG